MKALATIHFFLAFLFSLMIFSKAVEVCYYRDVSFLENVSLVFWRDNAIAPIISALIGAGSIVFLEDLMGINFFEEHESYGYQVGLWGVTALGAITPMLIVLCLVLLL